MRSDPGRMFASFAVRNYRLLFAGALISNLGTWVQRVGQDWLVLTELTEGSSAALGVVTGLQFLAIPILAPYAGAVVDWMPKRRVLFATQLLLGTTAFALWGVVVAGVVELWHVYVFAFLQGVITAFDNPARQSFVSEIVPAEFLPNAVGLNSMSFNGARLIGPGAAGLLIAAFGVGLTLLFNAVSFVFMLAAVVALRPAELRPSRRVKARGATRDGLRYLAGRPDLVILMVVVFSLGTFGMNFQIYNALMATEVFGKGAEEYGLLGTIMAVGTLGAALAATRRTTPSLRTVLAALGAFAASTALLAAAPSYPVYAVLLVPAGFFALTVMTTANAAVQLGTAPELRGRVLAVYVAIFTGGTPLGAPLIGWLGQMWGPREMVLTGAVATGLAALGVLAYLMLHDGVRLAVECGWPLRLRLSVSGRKAIQAVD